MLKIFLYRVILKFRFLFSDKLIVQALYWFVFNKDINWDNPISYNEKLNVLKVKFRNPYYSKLVDKYEVKRIVSQIIEEHHLDMKVIPTLGVWASTTEIDYNILPDSFVMKCTHDSGSVYICEHKKKIDKKSIYNKIEKKLSKNYFYQSWEYPYKYVQPRVIVEPLLKDHSSASGDLVDYKFYCNDGKVVCILVCTDRSKCVKYYYFDKDWNFLPWDRITKDEVNISINKPNKLKEMIEISELLSQNIPVCRVDLYDINNEIYFGEYTFFSNAGFDKTITVEADDLLGSTISII